MSSDKSEPMPQSAFILYISYDGLSDPLGQSQIIPYLEVLVQSGYKIHIISAEKKQRYLVKKQEIRDLLLRSGIEWTPILYTKNPPIVSTLIDIVKIFVAARKIYKQHSVDIIHSRSYISALVGLWLKKKYKSRFIFDMRGFWADERVEGNIWKLSNPLFRTVYKFFKKKEIDFCQKADSIVSLTHSGAHEIVLNITPYVPLNKIWVIPCCADLNHFSPQNVDEHKAQMWREKLKIPNSSFVLGYLGSIGTWYLLPEMVSFFKVLKQKHRPEAIFLFITMENESIVIDEFKRQSLDLSDLRVIAASRNELPDLLALFDVSVSFIKPTFSKKASSPTKLGELLGMGIPVFSNTGVGDIDTYYEKIPFLKVHEFSQAHFDECWKQFLKGYPYEKQTFVSLSNLIFSLEKGAARYLEIYRSL